ncbi:multidrug efflux MFS transporter [Bifidobacterium imperatoris]|uniref:MFS transporter n=1 Tax=Bifidobacterium imperatoris TaxID=2020965 RepID=A0A2N5IRB5_9BIFI|nr:MDR family MFS transporter [Bifidobacterium imperatoris]PLS24489.1 MFS transporter [Bifidobacterium imperatoris]QSY58092.1 multidrug efflux MFS transporter [Bifidobacterium imperatoris]
MAGESRIKNRTSKLQRVLSQEESYVDGKLSRAAFVSIAILTFITFVGNFTQLQLSSALPIIVSEFGISVTTGQWLTSVFQLVMGVMVPLTAFLTRRFSTRQIVICSMAVFTLGSVMAWLGPNFIWVLLGRVLEAAGTGVMWPVLQITVFSIYPLSRRGFAMGTVGMAMSVAPAIGPTLGGWQTDANGWRSIFLTMTIIGVLSLLAAMFWLHNFGSHDPSARADFFSVSLSVIGFGGLMFGFTNSEAYGFAAPAVWGPMLVGLVGIVWFVLRNLRHGRRYSEAKAAGVEPLPQPALLDLRVLKNRSFTVGTITASLAFFAFSSILVIMPLYIQTDRGFSATMSGLIMLPGAIGQCVSQFFGGRAMDRFGARPVALFGSIVLTVGTIGMSLVSMDTWIWWVSICQFVRQIGMGFLLMPITTWSLNCLNGPDEVSAGSSVTNTARQIAGAVGAPVLVILMETFAAWQHSNGASTVAASIFGIQWALRISAGICFVMVLMVAFGVRGDGAGHMRDAVSLRVLRQRLERVERNVLS